MKVLTLTEITDRDGYVHLHIPADLPETEVHIVVVVQEEKARVAHYDFSSLCGKLRWRGDAVAAQREIRDEW